MDGMFIAAGGLVLATIFIGLGTLGWRNSPAYRKLERLFAASILPGTAFSVGLVVGSGSNVQLGMWENILIISLPAIFWLSFFVWRTFTRELQREEPSEAVVESGPAESNGDRLKEGAD